MSYDSLKAAAGRERIDILQITRERCTLTNGVAPCTATSTCVNSWATCRSRANYDPEDFTVSFCTQASVIPSVMNVRGFVRHIAIVGITMIWLLRLKMVA